MKFVKGLSIGLAIVLMASVTWGQVTINFDDANKWTAGSATITSYASDHTYVDGYFSATGGPALRNTTTAQDGFPGALGTYAWRLSNNNAVDWRITISTGGVSTFSIDIRRWDGSPSPSYNLEYSTDGGSNWTLVSAINNTTLDNSSDWKTFNGTINSSNNNILIRLVATGTTERIHVDNFVWNNYSGGGNPTTSLPTFNPPLGTYYSTQNVEISCATEASTIYYTTNGIDPTDASTEYTDPIELSSTTTIKAIAYAEGYDPSEVATAVYTFPTINDISDISTLRAGATDGTVYRLTGEAVLTYQSASRNAKYIQDATGAILIDDYSSNISTTYSLYDGITGIVGTLSTFNSMLQFVPVTDPGAATSNGNTVTPVEVTLVNLDASYQAKLVKILDVTISGTGNFASSTNYTITDASGSGTLRTVYYDLNYIGQPIPSFSQNLTGVVRQSDTTMELVPRDSTDFEEIVPEEPTILISPETLTDFSYIEGDGPSTEKSFTVSGLNLTDDISITPPTNYEISTGTAGSFVATNPITLTQSGGTVGETTINVRLKAGLSVGDYNNETITASSTDADSKTVTCSGSVSPEPPKLFFSEYIEGSSNNKAIEFYNGSSQSVNLSNVKVILFSNGSASPSTTWSGSGTLEPKQVYVLYNSSAVEGISSKGDESSGVTNFNGDDALGLYYNDALIDVFGTIGTDPGSAWDVAGTSGATADKTLVRKETVTSGNTDWSSSAGTNSSDSEWIVYDQDTFDYLGSHVAPSAYATHTIGTGSNVSQAFTGTNVGLDFGNVSTGASVSVNKYTAGPANVSFSGSTPTNVSSYRWVINAGDLAFTGGTIKIAVEGLGGISDPGSVDIYKRSNPGTGAFTKLTTSYADGYLSASIDGFSEFILGSDDNSLPVTLSAFMAKAVKGTVVLEWETSAEIENQGFVLSRKSKVENQKSEVIASFATDDALKGRGTTTETTKYAYTDKSVEPGKTYVYTLADVDYSGNETVLEKVEVKVEAEGAVVADGYALNPVYPNPFNASLTVPFTLTEPLAVSIELYSLTGQHMMTVVNRDFGAGSYNYTVQADDLASGIYFVRTVFNGRMHMQKAVLLK